MWNSPPQLLQRKEMKGGVSSVGADGGADAAFRFHIGRETEIR